MRLSSVVVDLLEQDTDAPLRYVPIWEFNAEFTSYSFFDSLLSMEPVLRSSKRLVSIMLASSLVFKLLCSRQD